MDYNLEEILGNLYTQEYDDIMPKKNTTYDMCSRCENGVIPTMEDWERESEFNDEKWNRVLPYMDNNYTTVVETGTFLGHTTEYLSRRFDKVHTIELDEGLFNVVNKAGSNIACAILNAAITVVGKSGNITVGVT